MSKAYKYVGPEEITKRVAGQPKGIEIHHVTDVARWAASSGQQVSRGDLLPATFVVDPDERLLVADRHSEHVACAGGGDVLAAGEIFFAIIGESARVEQISNQSTGYCPEPESWEVVERVLDRSGIDHPDQFTTACIFRRCTACGERNIVKDAWFYCAVCGKELPQDWNF